MRTPKFLFAALFAVAAMASCQKDDKQASTTPKQPDPESTSDISTSMNIDEEITSFGQMGMEGNVVEKKSSQGCITVSLDTTGPTNEFTLDFGTTNCQGADGRFRRGKLIITVEDNPFDVGSITTVTSAGYAVNDYEVTGSKSMTFMGFDSNNDPYINLTTTLSIKRPDNKVVTWNSTQTRTWTDGFTTLDPKDNAVEIIGSANGQTADSVAYSVNIIDPLRVEATCSYIVSGSFKISSPVFADRTVDYGTGTCDNVATVTVNGVTFTINM